MGLQFQVKELERCILKIILSRTEATNLNIHLQLGIGIVHILYKHPERIFDLDKIFWIIK